MPAFLLLLSLLLAALPAKAQPAPASDPQHKVEEFTTLLADPDVQAWLRERAGELAAAPAAPVPATNIGGSALTGAFHELEARLDVLLAGLPRLPADLATAGDRLAQEIAEVGPLGALLLVLGFVALGLGTEWVFWRSSRSVRRHIATAPIDTLRQRLRIIGIRFLFGLCWIGAFAVGSLGACLLFPWPAFLRSLLLGALAVILAVRFTLVIARFLLSPGNEKLRIVPTTTEAAWFWTWRLAVFFGYLAFAWVVLDLVAAVGVTEVSMRLLGYMLGLGALVILGEAIWRQPPRQPGAPRPAAALRAAMIAYIAFAWLVGRVLNVVPLFDVMIVALLLPLAIRISHRAVLHLLRPGDLDGDGLLGDQPAAQQPPSAWTVVIERGLRLMFFAIGAWIIISGFGVDMNMMRTSDDLLGVFLRNLLRALAILLVADLLWQLAKTAIDHHLVTATGGSETDPTEVIRRRQRVRTLLPILRNVLFVVLITMAVLMALSSLGVEVGPLIAGAGVVGVAIGFGAQTLVKDVISGIFYLLDDAFRIGEYIVSGSYKGTVESFSLRSVKLRHQRGSLYTVPFGELGAIQNMSRDWVIDKLTINVTYDTDLDKAKKIIKQIGKDLLADEELGPGFIQPLKMQGVSSFGDFAMQITLKMMTYPGKQFTIRRKAYAMVKRAFAENGIQIAVPTVRVAGTNAHEGADAVAAKAANDVLAAKAAQA
ncbi:mechanosensitive ion channel family protein [Geminicoccus flavidas]|uniref:mechanosensitive ion channel family protein n=1 Tax=Geminicoccus flavidas TaxID=2506407 RepID=UPI001356AEC5|nr:mechanosensitive ion channel family protein [Geminicoccus flavidas]